MLKFGFTTVCRGRWKTHDHAWVRFFPLWTMFTTGRRRRKKSNTQSLYSAGWSISATKNMENHRRIFSRLFDQVSLNGQWVWGASIKLCVCTENAHALTSKMYLISAIISIITDLFFINLLIYRFAASFCCLLCCTAYGFIFTGYFMFFFYKYVFVRRFFFFFELRCCYCWCWKRLNCSEQIFG